MAPILRSSSAKARNHHRTSAAVFDGGRLSYRELDLASDQLAAALQVAGVKPGDPVALQLPNIPQFLISYFGILKAGAIVVPLNVLLRAPEVAFHLGDSGARVLITWEGVLAEAFKGAEAAGLDQTMPSVTRIRRMASRHSRGSWTSSCRTSRWRPGSRPTPPSSSTPQGRRDVPRAPSSRTSSCT